MKDLRITLVQSALHWEDKQKNLEMFSRKLEEIIDPTDLIILPEMFTTGFSMQPSRFAEKMDGETILWLKARAREKNCVISGSFICEEEGSFYNRLAWVRPDGSCETYDKRHLFRMAGEDEYYGQGNKKLITELKGWKICPLICYDLRFPIWSRNRNLASQENKNTEPVPEYDLLIYVANWPERRSHPWKTLLLARAIENQCYVAGINRVGDDGNGVYHSGDSAVIDPKGIHVSHLKTGEEGIETVMLKYAELQEFRKQFPAMLDADEFEVRITK